MGKALDHFLSRALAVVISGHFCRCGQFHNCGVLLSAIICIVSSHASQGIPRSRGCPMSKKCWAARHWWILENPSSWDLGISRSPVHVMHLKPNCRIHGSATVPIRVSYRDATRFSELISPQVLEK